MRAYEYLLALAIGVGDEPPRPEAAKELLENGRAWREHNPAGYFEATHASLIGTAEQQGLPDFGDLAL